MVDFVEGNDGGELFVDKGVDNVGDGLVGPLLEGLLDGGPVQGAGDDGRRGAVSGELALEGFHGGGLDGDVAAADAGPSLHEVAEDPGDDFAPQPGDVDGGVVAARLFALGVHCARGVDDVYQGVGVAEIVEELVAQAAALVGAGDEAGHVEELDGHGAPAVDAGAVVGFAAVRDMVAGAGAVDLEVADCSLGVDGGEAVARVRCRVLGADAGWRVRTGSCLVLGEGC